jgi:hypothetical protein
LNIQAWTRKTPLQKSWVTTGFLRTSIIIDRSVQFRPKFSVAHQNMENIDKDQYYNERRTKKEIQRSKLAFYHEKILFNISNSFNFNRNLKFAKIFQQA